MIRELWPPPWWVVAIELFLIGFIVALVVAAGCATFSN